VNLIDNFKGVLPKLCLITDDPYRVKMIAAHYLDNVEIFSETRGQVGLLGKYNDTPLTVMSVGIGTTSTKAYLTELCSKSEISRIVYLGDCITNDLSLPVASTTYISKAYDNGRGYEASKGLYKAAEIIMRKNNIKAQPCITTTYDYYFIDRKYVVGKESRVLDFATSAIYKLNAKDSKIETLSILNVYKNVETNERVEEAVRQSGFQMAVKSALQTVISRGY
jgi:purine-nucleoside phosphorylase